MHASLRPRARRLLLLAAAMVAGCGQPEAEVLLRAPVDHAEDVAEDIPMTGEASPLFAELDVAMRQFVKWRCVGASALAVSYKGRRIYKRGFGRMHGRASEAPYPGCGDDSQDPYDPDAALVQPDTPMFLGSNSKPVAAAVLRWLLDERVAAHPELLPPPCEGELCSCAEPPCEPTSADLRLLDPANDLLPAGLADIYRGDVPLPFPLVDEPCTHGHDPGFADPRWRDLTVTNLFSHQAGLGRGGVVYVDNVEGAPYFAEMRGYADGDEAAWIAEDASVRAANSALGPAIDAAAEWLGAREGDDPVYFVNRYNILAGEEPIEETLKLNAGACMEYTPGAAGVYTDDDGLYDPLGQSGEYSNHGYSIVGRIIDHIYAARSGGRYHAAYGQPQSHWHSALAEFFAEKLDIHEGVESPEGIFAFQGDYKHLETLGHPVPRIWDKKSYEPEAYEVKRPFCVWRGDSCDFGPWRRRRDADTRLRPNMDFQLLDDELGFAMAPRWSADRAQLGHAPGGLVVEMPVYLEFARKYYISGRSTRLDNGNGKERVGPLAGVSGGHAGALDGARAFVSQLVAQTGMNALPPLVGGHMVDDFDHLQSVRLDIPGNVDFSVAVNQNGDPRCTDVVAEGCGDEYSMLRKFVLFGLSRVDWSAVDELLAEQRDQVVGMALRDGFTHFWFADDHHVVWNGPPGSFPGRAQDDPGTVIASPLAGPYALPSTRIGPDVLGVAMAPDGEVFAWYNDGRYSAGDVRDLSASAAPLRFTCAEGQTPMDIVAVAIASYGVVYTWYADGTWSSGTASDLAAAGSGSYSLPPGYEPGDIEAIAFEPALPDRVWTRFGDGTIRIGTVLQPGTPG